MSNHPTEEEIRTKAYELWEHAGCPDGSEELYWSQAELILSGPEDTSAGD